MVPWPARGHKPGRGERGAPGGSWVRWSLDGCSRGAQTGGMGQRPGVAGWIVGAALGCTACAGPTMADVPSVVATAGAEIECAAPEAVSFAWALEAVPEDISLDLACTVTSAAAIADELAIGLRCEEGGVVVANTLRVWATPRPPRTALARGGAVRLRAFWVVEEGGAAEFVRLETAKGELLLAGARGGALAPPDGTDLWPPFTLTEGPEVCLSEETACGEAQRRALELRRAGAAPRWYIDASWAVVADRGEAQLWVEAAQTGEAGCVGAAGAWYSVGLMAAR